MLRIAFFGSSGEGTMVPLRSVAAHHRVIAIVRPRNASRAKAALRTLLRGRDSLAEYAWQHDVASIEATSGRDPDVEKKMGEFAPDVMCVSAFPWILDKAILNTVRLCAMNVHPSLLPRHRGPVPLFWIYYHNDRTTGVTIHRMDERADAGDILAQASRSLPRGYPADRLHADNAHHAARLLLDVLESVEQNTLQSNPQDDRLATYAPRVTPGVSMVNFAEWDAERVWHFLLGLCPRYREPLRDRQGRPVLYKTVLGYEAGENCGPAGTVESTPLGWKLYCRGGTVLLGEERSGVEC
jgi:methionyl-tRNA formyltransferase